MEVICLLWRLKFSSIYEIKTATKRQNCPPLGGATHPQCLYKSFPIILKIVWRRESMEEHKGRTNNIIREAAIMGKKFKSSCMQKSYIIIASLTSHLEDVGKLGGMVHVSLPTTGLVIGLTFLLEHIIIYSFGVMRLPPKNFWQLSLPIYSKLVTKPNLMRS